MSNKLCSLLINEVIKNYNENESNINNNLIKPLLNNIYNIGISLQYYIPVLTHLAAKYNHHFHPNPRPFY